MVIGQAKFGIMAWMVPLNTKHVNDAKCNEGNLTTTKELLDEQRALLKNKGAATTHQDRKCRWVYSLPNSPGNELGSGGSQCGNIQGCRRQKGGISAKVAAKSRTRNEFFNNDEDHLFITNIMILEIMQQRSSSAVYFPRHTTPKK